MLRVLSASTVGGCVPNQQFLGPGPGGIVERRSLASGPVECNESQRTRVGVGEIGAKPPKKLIHI